jgi:hypothetical protein
MVARSSVQRAQGFGATGVPATGIGSSDAI